jgi:SET domain-containing protein
MLFVNTKIANSDIHDVGLFACDDIEKGTQIWTLNPLTTQVHWKRKFLDISKTLPLPVLREFVHNSYIRQGCVYTVNDRTRFINHSEDPNIGFQSNKSIIALRDIPKGEELLEDYFISYDKDDFFFLDISQYSNKKELLEALKDHIMTPTRPKSRFEL